MLREQTVIRQKLRISLEQHYRRRSVGQSLNSTVTCSPVQESIFSTSL